MRLFQLILILLLPSSAWAEYESRQLFAKNDWIVELTYDTTNESFWCSAQTSNRSAQQFALTGYENDAASIFIFDDKWDLANRQIDFLIDIDYSRWNITGTGGGIGVSANLNDGDKASVFVGELAQGSAIAVYNSDERRIGTFSLSGSAAAINAFFDCWEKIAKPTDPFQTSSDPF